MILRYFILIFKVTYDISKFDCFSWSGKNQGILYQTIGRNPANSKKVNYTLVDNYFINVNKLRFFKNGVSQLDYVMINW